MDLNFQLELLIMYIFPNLRFKFKFDILSKTENLFNLPYIIKFDLYLNVTGRLFSLLHMHHRRHPLTSLNSALFSRRQETAKSSYMPLPVLF